MIKKEKGNNFSMILKSLNLAWSMGLIIVSPVVILSFLGLIIDKKFSTTPLFTVGFLFLGILAGVYSAIKEVKKVINNK